MMCVGTLLRRENAGFIEFFYFYSAGTMNHPFGIDSDTDMTDFSVLMIEEYQITGLYILQFFDFLSLSHLF